jgi:DMSO/TMAO reductase YedYZ molybdopterin-dependent catalytic subunit
VKPEDQKKAFTVDRRNFISKSIHFFADIGLLCGPLLTVVKNVWARTKRIILPKDTPMSSLVSKNPAALDTRNLQVIPLEKFETMGLTDHEVDLNRWRLEITGRVQKPLRMAYSQLLALPAIERNVLLICPGFFTDHGRWRGISVKPLLREAEAETAVTHVSFRGPDGRYAKEEQFSIDEVNSDKVFLAYQVNRRALPQKHGFPLRVVAEDHYGTKWVEFVHHIEVHKLNNPQ